MSIPGSPPRRFAPLFQLERSRLLELLQSLVPEEWSHTTACPDWNVLDLAIHLLGGDFSLLSWQRDDYHGTPALPGLDEHGFIDWLDGLQMEWVHAARRLSPRLVTDVLAWTDQQIVALVDAQNPSALSASVTWASDDLVPVWLDQGRELTERWIHRQQLLEAVGRPSDLRADLAVPVLDTLRWAYPYRLSRSGWPADSIIAIIVMGPEHDEIWRLRSDGSSWAFDSAANGVVVAQMDLTAEQAWRLLTNNYRAQDHGNIQVSGDHELVDVLIRARSIIGTPQ